MCVGVVVLYEYSTQHESMHGVMLFVISPHLTIRQGYIIGQETSLNITTKERFLRLLACFSLARQYHSACGEGSSNRDALQCPLNLY